MDYNRADFLIRSGAPHGNSTFLATASFGCDKPTISATSAKKTNKTLAGKGQAFAASRLRVKRSS